MNNDVRLAMERLGIEVREGRQGENLFNIAGVKVYADVNMSTGELFLINMDMAQVCPQTPYFPSWEEHQKYMAKMTGETPVEEKELNNAD